MIIGENSRIGAGSVVATNVPSNATVVGVPGHVIAYRDESNDTIQRLPDPEWDRIDSLEHRLQQVEQQLAKGGITDASTARSTDAPDIAASERDER